MSKTNKQIFQEYIDRVISPQNFDLIYDYCNEQCIFHSAPYVGLGITIDDSSGDKILIREIAPTGPAAAHLQEATR